MGAGVSLFLSREGVHGASIFSLFFSLISDLFIRDHGFYVGSGINTTAMISDLQGFDLSCAVPVRSGIGVRSRSSHLELWVLEIEIPSFHTGTGTDKVGFGRISGIGLPNRESFRAEIAAVEMRPSPVMRSPKRVCIKPMSPMLAPSLLQPETSSTDGGMATPTKKTTGVHTMPSTSSGPVEIFASWPEARSLDLIDGDSGIRIPIYGR